MGEGGKPNMRSIALVTHMMVAMTMIGMMFVAEGADTNNVFSPCADAQVQKFDGFTFGLAFSARDSFFFNLDTNLLTSPSLNQSVSWSGAGEYHAGDLPLVLSSRVNGESGILARSSSSTSYSDFGNPSGIGQSLSPPFSSFNGLAMLDPAFFLFFSIAAMPCKHPIKDFMPPA